MLLGQGQQILPAEIHRQIQGGGAVQSCLQFGQVLGHMGKNGPNSQKRLKSNTQIF